MSRRFDYQTFFRYYTNPQNVTREPLPRPRIQFFHNNTGIIYDDSLGDTSITIHGVKYYIKLYPKKGIQFTLPTTIPDVSGEWDFHYHFGTRIINAKNKYIFPNGQKNTNVVYFHKTVQLPHVTNKDHANCFFLPNVPIDDISLIPDIDCIQTVDSKMVNRFPLGSEDLAVITELIRRPFYGRQYGGRRKTKKVYQKGARKTKRRRTLIHSI